MKTERFLVGSELFIQRHRHIEGPPIVYVVRSGRRCQPFFDAKSALRFIKWPKGTPTGDAIREWFASFDDAAATGPELNMEQVKKEGFGPEAHDEDPTANTKMVT